MTTEDGLAEAIKRMAEEELDNFKDASQMSEDEIADECFEDCEDDVLSEEEQVKKMEEQIEAEEKEEN